MATPMHATSKSVLCAQVLVPSNIFARPEPSLHIRALKEAIAALVAQLRHRVHPEHSVTEACFHLKMIARVAQQDLLARLVVKSPHVVVWGPSAIRLGNRNAKSVQSENIRMKKVRQNAKHVRLLSSLATFARVAQRQRCPARQVPMQINKLLRLWVF